MNSPSLTAAHLHLWFLRNLKLVLAFTLLFLFALLLSSFSDVDGSTAYIRGSPGVHGNAYKFWGGAVRPGEFSVKSSVISDSEWHVAAVADLDKRR